MSFSQFVTADFLISPVNGHKVKRLLKSNIQAFGFESIDDLERQFPGFPRNCPSTQEKITKNGAATRQKSLAVKGAERSAEVLARYEAAPKFCQHCAVKIPFDFRANTFCSIACGNRARIVSDQQKQKTSNALTGRRASTESKLKKVKPTCQNCGKSCRQQTASFCSKTCFKSQFVGPVKQNLQTYRAQCAFKFNLGTYPNEFDFSLIKTHGWYSAVNRGNNASGVSRDHMVSVKYGFIHNIDPSIIAHPANCCVITQSQNASKSDKCAITLEELLARIEQWDQKYGMQ